MFMHRSVLSSPLYPRRTKTFAQSNCRNSGRRRKLHCLNGQYLEIGTNGRVKGTTDYHSPLALLELVPVARDLIHIKAVHTGFYLAVNEYGQVYTTEMRNEECIFRERLTRNFYDKYCSYKYSNMGLALGLMKTEAAVTFSRTAGLQQEYETQFVTKICKGKKETFLW